MPDSFDETHPFYIAIQKLSNIRAGEPALRYGRQYIREISANRMDFAVSTEPGGVLAYSRILNNQEILIVLNTSTYKRWEGDVIVDFALNFSLPPWKLLYSNIDPKKKALTVKSIPQAIVQKLNGERFSGPLRACQVSLEAMEIQILKKAG
jgi:hypothetical protein